MFPPLFPAARVGVRFGVRFCVRLGACFGVRLRFHLAALLSSLWITVPASAQSLLVIENPADRITYGKTFTLGDGFVASDGVPPYYLTEDPWPVAAHPQPGRNLGVASARSALGARVGPTTVDYFFRRDWWIEGSAGALRYYELSRRSGRVASGETLDIDYSWQGFDADGLRVSLADRVDIWHDRDMVLGISLAALRLQQVRRESGRGRFTSDGTTASLQSQRDIWYSGFDASIGSGGLTSFTPDAIRAVPGNGYGFSIDVGMRYDFGIDSTLRIAATDLFSHLKWGDVPHLTQTANVAADAESDLVGANPGVNQRSAYDTLRFSLPPKVMLALDFAPSYRWRLHGEQVWHRDETFLLFGASVLMTDALHLRTDYDLRWKTVGLRLDYRRFSLGLRTDNLSPRRAHAAGATLRFELDY